MSVNESIGPTSPAVPMPEPAGVFVILNTIVDKGPRTALAIIGGIHILGFLMMFGIWSMLVPTP